MAQRQIRRHATRLSDAHLGAAEPSFHVNQRVMTPDGVAGRVILVSESFSPGNTEYQVMLDNGMGGGTYLASQLRPLPEDFRAAAPSSNLPAGVTAALESEADLDAHTADLDYPEMGTILTDRPDPAHQIRMIGIRAEGTRDHFEMSEPEMLAHLRDEHRGLAGGEDAAHTHWEQHSGDTQLHSHPDIERHFMGSGPTGDSFSYSHAPHSGPIDPVFGMQHAAAAVQGHGLDPYAMAMHGLSGDDARYMAAVIDHIRRGAPQSEPIDAGDAETIRRSMHGISRMEQAGHQISAHVGRYPRGFGIDLHHNHTLHLVPERHGGQDDWYARISHKEFPMGPRIEHTIHTSDENLPHAVSQFLAHPDIQAEMEHQRTEGHRIHQEIREENRGLYGEAAAVVTDHIDDHGDAPDHGLIPRAADPDAYDTQSTEGQPDPTWDEDPYRRKSKDAPSPSAGNQQPDSTGGPPDGMGPGDAGIPAVAAAYDDTGDRWHEFRSRYQPDALHRGIHVELPPHVHDIVHDRSLPRGDRAEVLSDHLSRQGLGMHWTPHLDIAQRAISNAADRARGGSGWDEYESEWGEPGDDDSGQQKTDVMLHIRQPGERNRVRNPRILHERGIGWQFSPDEDEMPLKPGSPARLTGISWRVHQREYPLNAYEHHDFTRPVRHEARVPWTDAEREHLHSWQEVPTVTVGDFVPSYNFTNRHPDMMIEEPQEEGIAVEGAFEPRSAEMPEPGSEHELHQHLRYHHGVDPADMGAFHEEQARNHAREHLRNPGGQEHVFWHHHDPGAYPQAGVSYEHFHPDEAQHPDRHRGAPMDTGTPWEPLAGDVATPEQHADPSKRTRVMHTLSALSRDDMIGHMHEYHHVEPGELGPGDDVGRLHRNLHANGVDWDIQNGMHPHTHSEFLREPELSEPDYEDSRGPLAETDRYRLDPMAIATPAQHEDAGIRPGYQPRMHTLSGRAEAVREHQEHRASIGIHGLQQHEAASDRQWEWHMRARHGWDDAAVDRVRGRGDQIRDVHDALHESGAANHYHPGAPGQQDQVLRREEESRWLTEHLGPPARTARDPSGQVLRGGREHPDPYAAVMSSEPATSRDVEDVRAGTFPMHRLNSRAYLEAVAARNRADEVRRQLLKDYPPDALDWVHGAQWSGPHDVPLDEIDFENASSWNASHEPKRVRKFVKKIRKREKDGTHAKPAILVSRPGKPTQMVADGHHRTLAYQELNQPVWGYTAHVNEETGPWDTMHDEQFPEDQSGDEYGGEQQDEQDGPGSQDDPDDQDQDQDQDQEQEPGGPPPVTHGPPMTQGSQDGRRERQKGMILQTPQEQQQAAEQKAQLDELNGDEGGSSEGGGESKPPKKSKAAARAFELAAASPSFGFHFTAAWQDVVAKARRLRQAGRVRITAVAAGYVIGEVGGDHDVYESSVQRAPGHPNSIMAFACGCPWASFHQDKSYPGRLNGRPCSHAYAVHLESLSRRMNGRPMTADPEIPDWLTSEVVVKSMPPWGAGGWAQTWTAPATARPFYASKAAALTPAHEAAQIMLDGGTSPAAVEILLVMAGLRSTADQANAPWGSQNVPLKPPEQPHGATEPPQKDMDPGSYGPLAGPDPENWGEIQDSSVTQSPAIGGTDAALHDENRENHQHPRPSSIREATTVMEPVRVSQRAEPERSHGGPGLPPEDQWHGGGGPGGDKNRFVITRHRPDYFSVHNRVEYDSDDRFTNYAHSFSDAIHHLAHLHAEGHYSPWQVDYQPKMHKDDIGTGTANPRGRTHDITAQYQHHYEKWFKPDSPVYQPFSEPVPNYRSDMSDEEKAAHIRSWHPALEKQIGKPGLGKAHNWEHSTHIDYSANHDHDACPSAETEWTRKTAQHCGYRSPTGHEHMPAMGDVFGQGAEDYLRGEEHGPGRLSRLHQATPDEARDRNWAPEMRDAWDRQATQRSLLVPTAASPLPQDLGYRDVSSFHERQDSFPYADQSNTAGPSTSITPRDPDGIRMEEALRRAMTEVTAAGVKPFSPPPKGPEPADEPEHPHDCTCPACDYHRYHAQHARAVWASAEREPVRGTWHSTLGDAVQHAHQQAQLSGQYHYVSGVPAEGGGHLGYMARPVQPDYLSHFEVGPHGLWTRYHRGQADQWGGPPTQGDMDAIRGTYAYGDPRTAATASPSDAEAPQLSGGLGADLHDHPEPALDPDGLTAGDAPMGGGGAAGAGDDQSPAAQAGLGEWGASRRSSIRSRFGGSPDSGTFHSDPPGGYPLDAQTTGGGPGVSQHDQDSLGWDEPSIQTTGQQQWSGGGADSDEVTVPAGQPQGSSAEDDIVRQFQASRAAQALGSGGSSGPSDGGIAEAARHFLKTGKVLPEEEAGELIREGRGTRARNLDLLDLDGTHYAAEEDAMARRGLSMDDYDDDLALI